MAKTYRILWPRLVAWDNLVAAYRACRRRKRFKPEAAAFDYAWESNLLALQGELRDGSYQPGPYRHFYIVDPKRRKISAAPFRDRIVHHAVVRVLEPIFERQFIFDSYACRRGKGTHRACDRAQQFLRRHEYYLKTDVVKFFPNVDHALLLAVIRRRIADERLLALIERILASGEGVLAEEATQSYFPGDDLFAVCRPKGLPIGNLTSQFFANVFLNTIDHYVMEELRVPGYVRYADDLVLFADTKPQLWAWRQALDGAMARLRLRLHVGKTVVRPCRGGLTFLGMRLHREGRRLPQSSAARFNRRLRRLRWLWRHGRILPHQLGASLTAWRAHASYANCAGVRRALWRRARFTRQSGLQLGAETSKLPSRCRRS